MEERRCRRNVPASCADEAAKSAWLLQSEPLKSARERGRSGENGSEYSEESGEDESGEV